MPSPFPAPRFTHRSAQALNEFADEMDRRRRETPQPPPEPFFSSAFSILFGKAREPWSSGNTITLDPCVGPTDGTLLTPGAAIDIYLYLPTAYVPKENQVTISADDILGYLPFTLSNGNTSGVLVSVPIKTRTCT